MSNEYPTLRPQGIIEGFSIISASRMLLKPKTAFLLLCGIGVGLIGFRMVFMDCNGWLQVLNTSLSACASDENNNVLFVRKLNRTIRPFLSAKTTLSEDAFNWWKRIQLEQRNFTFYKGTVKKLFEIFPSIPDLGKACSARCRTCAVVGNSVNLKGSGYGPLIDYQDIVIRMNFAPVKGYEKDVGNRTTYRVMYPESAMDLENSTHLVLFPFKIQDLDWLIKVFTTGFIGRSYAPLKFKLKANKDLVKVINPAFMQYSHKVWLEGKGSYPSTGFMTLILALHICDEVHVFGYGADSDGNWSHYFEALKNKNLRTGPHPGLHEYNLLQRLAVEKTVELHRGV